MNVFARLRPQLVGDALGRFQHRMEVVVGDQLGAAETQHIGMDAAAPKVVA